jgi:hypothetical protein
MTKPPRALPPVADRPFPVVTAVILSLLICACAVYSNLSFTVTNSANYAYFPPFIRGYNANDNRHLGAEYWNIASSMARGEGFANPFPGKTGPTAWMPPLLPALLAGLHWACEGDKNAVMIVFVFLQTMTLIGTGLLVLELARRTTRLWAVVPAALFLGALLYDFRQWFQNTHDCWLVLLALDVLLAGLVLGSPLRSHRTAAGWGLCGGLFALVSPIVGLAWGGLTLIDGLRLRDWRRPAVAVLVAALTLTPWTVRNAVVFGRLVPVKSNAAYEAYQSQCLQSDGLLQGKTFRSHPYAFGGRERQEYRELGESAFLDRKRDQFLRSVWADPADFLDRVAARLLGATLWYVPMDRTHEIQRPRSTLASRVLHPIPFLALLVLAFMAVRKGVDRAVAVGACLYVLYLAPYVAISYYERYAAPLVAVKVLLVVWAVQALLSLVPVKGRPRGVVKRTSVVPGERHARPVSSR